MNLKDTYFLGKITRTHGLKGNVVLKLDTDQPEMYNELQGVFIEINGLLVPFFIEIQQWTKDNSKIISFKNSTPQMVEQIVNRNVYLPLSTLPQLTGNQFYYHEVIGFSVVQENGAVCGKITAINDQTAQHYFILDLEGREVIIPIFKDWMISVNRENKSIMMQLPEGLMDVFLTKSVNDEG